MQQTLWDEDYIRAKKLGVSQAAYLRSVGKRVVSSSDEDESEMSEMSQLDSDAE